MIAKSLLAGALALVLSPSPQAIGTTTAFVAPNPYIEQIVCDTSRGTGFKLASGTWVSANHVTENANCTVDGIPIVVTGHNEQKDWSTFTIPGDKRKGGLTADCSGYRDQQWYFGQGHARGLQVLTSVPVMFSRFVQPAHPRRWATLIYSRFIPGQSGGPVLSSAGEVVGIVNAFAVFLPASFSIALKDTPICQDSAAQSQGVSSGQAG